MGGLVLDSAIVCLLRLGGLTDGFVRQMLTLSSRIILFLGCRKYLLRTLYHDLLKVAKDDVLDIGDGGDELIELPQPTAAGSKPGRELRGHFHSTLARTVFSVCFGESITLFTLLMFQGLDILDVRYAYLA